MKPASPALSAGAHLGSSARPLPRPLLPHSPLVHNDGPEGEGGTGALPTGEGGRHAETVTANPRPAPAAASLTLLRPGPGGRRRGRTYPLLEGDENTRARRNLRLRALQLVQNLRVRVAPLPRLKNGLLAPRHALRQLGAGLHRRRHGLRPGAHQQRGSPAFLLGPQVSALVLERKRLQITARDAKRAA